MFQKQLKFYFRKSAHNYEIDLKDYCSSSNLANEDDEFGQENAQHDVNWLISVLAPSRRTQVKCYLKD